MFSKNTIKVCSIIAIVLCSLGLALSFIGAIFINQSSLAFGFWLGIISWSLLLWASILAYKLVSKYNLYEEEYKKVGYRVYGIMAAFVLFLFVGLVFGLIISVSILSSLWALKKNYDDWADTHEIESIGSEVE